jgi:NADPH:quinone reductase-like Zn-dependent oxidoreductase
MRAVIVKQPGGPENMFIGEVPKPFISLPNEILVRVYASAINRADILQRQGRYPPSPGNSNILGLG